MNPNSSFGQLRVNGLAFRPDRDIVNLFPALCQASAYSLATQGWPSKDFKKLASELNIPDSELVHITEAISRYLQASTAWNQHSFEDLWFFCGLDKVSNIARIAMFMHIGIATMRSYHHYSRQANPTGYQPINSEEAVEALDKSQWANKAELPHVKERRVSEIDKPLDIDGTEIS